MPGPSLAIVRTGDKSVSLSESKFQSVKQDYMLLYNETGKVSRKIGTVGKVTLRDMYRAVGKGLTRNNHPGMTSLPATAPREALCSRGMRAQGRYSCSCMIEGPDDLTILENDVPM